jgi:hypothetical protein
MLSATFGMVREPSPPTNRYRPKPIQDELFMALLTLTDGCLSYNHAGTAITTAKLNKTTPNRSDLTSFRVVNVRNNFNVKYSRI